MSGIGDGLRREYGKLYEQVRDIVADADPIELVRQGSDKDEYDMEVAAILPLLPNMASVDSLQRMIYNIFVQKFDRPVAGPSGKYRIIAERLLELGTKQSASHGKTSRRSS